MPYAILRVKKLKTAGAIQAVGEHLTRGRETPNADPTRECRTLVGLTDPWAGVQRRIEEVDAHVRTNGVLACEVFLGASPEYFRPEGGPAGTWDEARLQAWLRPAVESLRREWGPDNVVSAYLHLDEATPHIQAIVVPIDPDTKRLNASRWLDGRKALSGLQDRHAADMHPLGLERGIRGSLASHTEVRDWYGQLHAPVDSVPSPTVQVPGLQFTTRSREEWAQEESQRLSEAQSEPVSQLQTQARAYHEAAAKRDEYEATAKRLAKELEAVRKELGPLKEIAAMVRTGVTLADAAAYFEPGELAQAGVKVASDATGRSRVYNQAGKVVGRNAIDLVMLATKSDYSQALVWLAGRGGPGAAQHAAINAAVQVAYEAATAASQEAISPAVMQKRLTLAIEQGQRLKTPPQGQKGWATHLRRHGFGLRETKEGLVFEEVFSKKAVEPIATQREAVPQAIATFRQQQRGQDFQQRLRPRGPSR